MSGLNKAKNPFRFCTRMNLTELTGLRAANLSQLLGLLQTVPGASIYHHTHRFLQQHQYLSPEPPNDFAYWATEILGEDELGERLASIDTVKFVTIRSLREELIKTVQDYLESNPVSKLRFAKENEVFHFMKSVSFIFQTDYIVEDLQGFSETLKKITIDSIYFHIFEARLRLERGTNDFSIWLQDCLEEGKLAQKIAKLDPYTFTMEDLRKKIIRMVEERL
jgi:hypothetical protein